jgi:chromate transporter
MGGIGGLGHDLGLDRLPRAVADGELGVVVQFVAFLGAYHHPDPLTPWTAAVVGALLTTWVTFVPCFLFIFLGAPHVERLRGNHSLSAALTGITAAVVG